MRKAKIIATLGPSSSTIEKLEEMIRAGMDVARINMSHGTHEGHAKVMANVREASRRVGKEVAILLDLQGPKIRVDKLPQPLILNNGEEWVIGPSKVREQYPQYAERFIPTIYEHLVEDAHVGCSILFDDGLIEAVANEKEGAVLKIKILIGGELKSNKGINLPDVQVSAPSVTAKDEEDLMFGLQQGIDYVALSFVRTKEDILKMKAMLHQIKLDTPVVAKIERPEAVLNIEDIAKVADVIMIARGDMGVELGNQHVPSIQKKIINICNDLGVPVITATQMLESMIQNSRPTRAEASDVANAIWDGTDVVMLSGETASGKYPLATIKMMDNIVREAEKFPRERPFLRDMDLASVNATAQVAASLIAEKTAARLIISFTSTGSSCLKMSRFRPKIQVLGVTRSIKTLRKICMYWGITPFYYDVDQESEEHQLERGMIDLLKKESHIQNGDKVVITHGDKKVFSQRISNTVKIEIIKDAPQVLGGSDTLEEVTFDRGKILLDTHLCSSCQNCITICPFDIWQVSSNSNQSTMINKENASKCTLDMACVESCPTGAIEIIPKV